MGALTSAVMAVAVISSFLLIAGGVRLATIPQSRGRGALMIIAALVILMNVMIWTL